MKALTLWQPWATAMLLGVKRNETRSRWFRYRGPLVICAAKRPMDKVAMAVWEKWIRVPIPQDHYGCALCVVTVTGCNASDAFNGGGIEISEMERALGNYTDGRCVLRTKNLFRLWKAIPVRGMQGLFNLPADLEKEIRRQMSL